SGRASVGAWPPTFASTTPPCPAATRSSSAAPTACACSTTAASTACSSTASGWSGAPSRTATRSSSAATACASSRSSRRKPSRPAAAAIYDDVIPGNRPLAEAELALTGKMGRELTLRRALRDVAGSYDVVLVDCPPALGLLTVNALVAADHALITAEAQYFAL